MYISADEAHTAGKPVRQEREPRDICVKRGTLVLPMSCDTYHACQADCQMLRWLSTISSLEASLWHVMWLWLYVTTMQCASTTFALFPATAGPEWHQQDANTPVN